MLFMCLMLVEKSVAVICGIWFMISKLLLLMFGPIMPLSGRWRFIWKSSEWHELLRSRLIAAAAAARRNN